jgi:hypothetical protein
MKPISRALLATTLGIKAGAKVSIHNPPPGFVARLNPLPEGVEFLVTATTGLDVILFFASQPKELVEKLPALARAMAQTGGIWVCWPAPKEGKEGLPGLLSEDFVRQVALDLGLVDNKIAVLDEVWTGLRLVRPQRPRLDKPERRTDGPPLAQA